MVDATLRLIAIFLLLSRSVYWFFTGITAKKAKPPTKIGFSWRAEISRAISWGFSVLIFLQLGKMLTVLPIHVYQPLLQAVGLVVCSVGTIICFVARYELGVNWSHAADYQIKSGHTLVTNGIYQFVRHPIYLGLTLAWIGAEMVAGSYLFISFFALFFVFYIQGKREERNFLRSNFGDAYKDYMKTTKMLVPFVL